MKYEFEHTLPIAMWDYSWLEQHHRGGSFADYDRVIDELVERGYEAVRIDVFPHLIASDRFGNTQETFHFDHDRLGFSLWGRCFSLELNVRSCLVEFIHKLQDRGIRIGLSTWIQPVREGRHSSIGDVNDFVRIWDETLTFLKENGCLENVIYVDLLNEYPMWHDYVSFKEKYFSFEEASPEQDRFCETFARTAITALSQKWPDLRFLFSQTENYFTDRDLNKDYSLFGALDVHIWMTHNHELSDQIKYLSEAHAMSTDIHFRECNRTLHDSYFKNEDKYNRWMEERIAQEADIAKKYHSPVGNTEGWGVIMWAEHPYLEWDMIKHAGLVSAQMAVDHGYSFVCSCNFCHPHFKGIWDDIAWHHKITDIIRKGKPEY